MPTSALETPFSLIHFNHQYRVTSGHTAIYYYYFYVHKELGPIKFSQKEEVKDFTDVLPAACSLPPKSCRHFLASY